MTTTDPTTPAPELTALGDEKLIEKMLESTTLAAAITTRADIPEHERNGRYGQLQAVIDKHVAELKRRLSLSAAERPAEGDTVTISVDAAYRAADSLRSGQAVATNQWEGDVPEAVQAVIDADWSAEQEIRAALAASSAPALSARPYREVSPMTNPTTPAPELTAPTMLLLDKHKLQVAIGEFVYQRFQCGQERALAEAEGFMRHIPDSAYVANEYAAAERTVAGGTVTIPSELLTLDDLHQIKFLLWMRPEPEAFEVGAKVEKLTKIIKRNTLAASSAEPDAAERPAEGDTVTISERSAVILWNAIWQNVLAHAATQEQIEAHKELSGCIGLIAASSAEPDAALGQGEGE